MVLAVKARSPKRLLQLFQTVSSSVYFSTFMNSLVRFWIFYLWVKGNPKNPILQINALQFVYVESCYKIFTSTYKKSNYNDDISNLSDLTFDEMCLFLDEWSRWHSARRTKNRYVTKKKNLRKIRCKCFDTVLGSDSLKKHNIIKVDVSSNELTYLYIGWWWRRNTYNMRDKQYSVGFGCWNANICKRHKTQQQEEPSVLNAINKIVFFKSSV